MVAGDNVVRLEWAVQGPDIGKDSDVNTEQHWVTADVCWYNFIIKLILRPLKIEQDILRPKIQMTAFETCGHPAIQIVSLIMSLKSHVGVNPVLLLKTFITQ